MAGVRCKQKARVDHSRDSCVVNNARKGSRPGHLRRRGARQSREADIANRNIMFITVSYCTLPSMHCKVSNANAALEPSNARCIMLETMISLTLTLPLSYPRQILPSMPPRDLFHAQWSDTRCLSSLDSETEQSEQTASQDAGTVVLRNVHRRVIAW